MSKYSEATLMQFARDNMLARIVVQPDACRYCKDFHGRIYRPSEAPEIPIRGCTKLACRCRYEPIDAATPEEKLLLYQGVDAAKLERKEEARKLLSQAVELNEADEQAWLWLSGCVDDLAEQVRCLEKVLALNPDNELARKGLERLWKLVEEAAPAPPEAAEEEEEAEPPPEAKEEIAGEKPAEPAEQLPPEPQFESRLLSRLRSIPLTPAEAEQPPIHRAATIEMPALEGLSLSEDAIEGEEAEEDIHRDETIAAMPALEGPPVEAGEILRAPETVLEEEYAPFEEAEQIALEEEYPPLPSADVETLLLPRLEVPAGPAVPEPEAEAAPLPLSPPGIPRVIACPQCGVTNLITGEHCTECGLDLLPGMSVAERLAQVGCGCFFCFLAYLIAVFTQTGALTSLRVNLEACVVSVFVFAVAAFIAASRMEGHPPWQKMPLADRHRRRAERYSDTNPAQAIADYGQAARLAPEDGALYRARAELYEKIGYRQEALEDYEIYRSWAASGGKGKEADFATAQIARLREEMGHHP